MVSLVPSDNYVERAKGAERGRKGQKGAERGRKGIFVLRLPFKPFSASLCPLVLGAIINLCAKRTTLFSFQFSVTFAIFVLKTMVLCVDL